MKDYQVLLVCGMGRCGTSLVMQVLDQIGIKVPGFGPYFEPSVESRKEPGWAFGFEAIKILDPSRITHIDIQKQIGFRQAKVLWLMRDPIQQAKSWVKFSTVHGKKMPDYRQAMEEATAHIVNKTWFGLETMARISPPTVMWFDHIIEQPDVAVPALARWACVEKYNQTNAVAIVANRSPYCLEKMAEGMHPEYGGKNKSILDEWFR